MATIADKIVTLAKGEIGVKEQGKNWGAKVQQYLKSVGIGFPAAWCMAFCYWVTSQLGWKNPLFKTGGVLDQWNNIPKKYRTKIPAPGFIGFINHGKGKGHAFIVCSSAVNGKIETVEGNSNSDGGREGIEVAGRNRETSTVNLGYANLPQMIADKNNIDVNTGAVITIAGLALFFCSYINQINSL